MNILEAVNVLVAHPMPETQEALDVLYQYFMEGVVVGTTKFGGRRIVVPLELKFIELDRYKHGDCIVTEGGRGQMIYVHECPKCSIKFASDSMLMFDYECTVHGS